MNIYVNCPSYHISPLVAEKKSRRDFFKVNLKIKIVRADVLYIYTYIYKSHIIWKTHRSLILNNSR